MFPASHSQPSGVHAWRVQTAAQPHSRRERRVNLMMFGRAGARLRSRLTWVVEVAVSTRALGPSEKRLGWRRCDDGAAEPWPEHPPTNRPAKQDGRAALPITQPTPPPPRCATGSGARPPTGSPRSTPGDRRCGATQLGITRPLSAGARSLTRTTRADWGLAFPMDGPRNRAMKRRAHSPRGTTWRGPPHVVGS